MKKVENDNIMKEYIKDAEKASSDGQWAALEYDKELHDMMIQNNMIDEVKKKVSKLEKRLVLKLVKKWVLMKET